jgi:hypothetical protein
MKTGNCKHNYPLSSNNRLLARKYRNLIVNKWLQSKLPGAGIIRCRQVAKFYVSWYRYLFLGPTSILDRRASLREALIHFWGNDYNIFLRSNRTTCWNHCSGSIFWSSFRRKQSPWKREESHRTEPLHKANRETPGIGNFNTFDMHLICMHIVAKLLYCLCVVESRPILIISVVFVRVIW